MNAAENLTILLHAVTDDPAAAMLANRRESLYGAFETVEDMKFTGDGYFECFVIFISARLTCDHFLFSSKGRLLVGVVVRFCVRLCVRVFCQRETSVGPVAP
jgi:hypothetical protein